jgi:hypothetical protein
VFVGGGEAPIIAREVKLAKVVNGQLDTAFGASGIGEASPWSEGDVLFDVHVTSDGKPIVAGAEAIQGQGLSGSPVASRYLASGLLDGAYGSRNFAPDDRLEWAAGPLARPRQRTATVLDGQDRLLIAGAGDCTVSGGDTQNIAVHRFTSTGALDPTFGRGGNWCGPAPALFTHTIAVAHDAAREKLVIVGTDDAGTQLYLYRLTM